jgi:hypothetical protein
VPIQYLVPCSCGRKLPVETRQAGESITCECGNILAIPRLLELKKLEKTAVQEKIVPVRSAWGVGHGLALAGMSILLIVLALWVYVILFVPGNPYERITPDQIREQHQKKSPMQTWQEWVYYQKSGLSPRKERIDRYFEGRFAQRQMILTYFGIASAVGGAVLATGIVVIYRKRSIRSVLTMK